VRFSRSPRGRTLTEDAKFLKQYHTALDQSFSVSQISSDRLELSCVEDFVIYSVGYFRSYVDFGQSMSMLGEFRAYFS